jgi:hypothetical protein
VHRGTRGCQAERLLDFLYWSLSKSAKLRVKNAVNCIGDFEKTLAAEAERCKVDGVVCGHIHHAAVHDRFGVRHLELRRLGGKLHLTYRPYRSVMPNQPDLSFMPQRQPYVSNRHNATRGTNKGISTRIDLPGG